MKFNTKQNHGFTIVELLVVIVVIGILAAITIVSYTGVTTRAKTAQAQSNASSAQSVAEAYNADNGYYPQTQANFKTGSAITKLPSGMYIGYTTGTTNNSLPINATYGDKTVSWDYCGANATPAATEVLGGRIGYWDFNTSSIKYLYVGSGVVTAGTATCNAYVTPSA